jgi:putative membrane protein
MMHWGNFGGMGYGGFGGIIMILFWAFVIFGIVYLLKQIFSDKKVTSRTESAENILKKRYAAGEIATEEYYERLRIISG